MIYFKKSRVCAILILLFVTTSSSADEDADDYDDYSAVDYNSNKVDNKEEILEISITLPTTTIQATTELTTEIETSIQDDKFPIIPISSLPDLPELPNISLNVNPKLISNKPEDAQPLEKDKIEMKDAPRNDSPNTAWLLLGLLAIIVLVNSLNCMALQYFVTNKYYVNK